MDSSHDMAARREYHSLQHSALRYLYIKRRYMNLASDLYKCLCQRNEMARLLWERAQDQQVSLRVYEEW